jgi:uncharacterized protein
MLKNTYIHIPYVGYITERKIWNSGIQSWDSFDENKLNLADFRKDHIKKFVMRSLQAYNNGDYQFFSKTLPSHEHWRCLNDFEKVAYVDIETTGLDKHRDDITLIGVYDGEQAKTFVRGKEFEEFKEYIREFPMIVTFNGSTFDLPFIEHKLGTKFNQIHLDLRFAFSRLGICGGLKNIEKRFGLERSTETDGLNGLDAVRLWHKYVNGDDGALELLKKYNKEDIVNLKMLGETAFDMLKKQLLRP